jgi:tetratricopeptide (TPR) repeat protein
MLKENANALIEKGIDFFNSENFKEAVNCFAKVKDNPSVFNFFTLYKWGNAFYHLAKIKRKQGQELEQKKISAKKPVKNMKKPPKNSQIMMIC